MWNGGATYGEKREGVSCPRGEGGRSLRALLSAGITAVHSGHDHGNDYFGVYAPHANSADGRAALKYSWMQQAVPYERRDVMLRNVTYGAIRLAYGRKSGHGGYDPDMPKGSTGGFIKGARVIVLREGESDAARSETYLRLENGEKLEQAAASEKQTSDGWEYFCER